MYDFWATDDSILDEAVFKAMREAAKDLAKADPTIAAANTLLVEISQTLAVDAVNAAIDLKPQKAVKAQSELDDAMDYAAEASFVQAIDQFRIAWEWPL